MAGLSFPHAAAGLLGASGRNPAVGPRLPRTRHGSTVQVGGVVASARITYTYAEGQTIDLEVDDDEAAYPDSLDQVVAEVLRMFRETVLA
jgi:hypothetical protein